MSGAWSARIPVIGGEMHAYLAGAEGRRPGVVVLQEIFGVNMAMQEVVDQLAAEGYLVCAPDLFHRLEPRVALSYQPEDRPKALALWELFDQDLDSALSDVRRTLDYVAAHPCCNGDVAMIGFCLGGKLALLTAAAGRREPVVSFYPVQMQRYRQEMALIRSPVQVQLGVDDYHIPPEVIDGIKADVAALPDGETIVHEQAGHGFFNRFRNDYSPIAAIAARGQVTRFLERTIGPALGAH